MIPGAAERDRRLGVPYATTAERARFLVRFQNGVWINSLNNVIHCTAHEILIFVMGSDGNFYASKIDSRTGRSENGVKHSSFFAGQGVAASGEWRIEHGILIFFSNRSGHYAQDASFMEQALQQLRELGVDTTRIQVDFRFYETPQAVTP